MPKGQHLVPLVPRYWGRSIKYMYIPYWFLISLILDFANCAFCNSKANPEIKDANKISHELKHRKFDNRKENSDHRKKKLFAFACMLKLLVCYM